MSTESTWQALAASLTDLALRLRVVGWSIDPEGRSDDFVALGRAADQSIEHLDAVLGECARTDCLSTITLPDCARFTALPQRTKFTDAETLDEVGEAAAAMAAMLDACAHEIAGASSSALYRELAAETRMQQALLRAIAERRHASGSGRDTS